jgi:hypothetical protein
LPSALRTVFGAGPGVKVLALIVPPCISAHRHAIANEILPFIDINAHGIAVALICEVLIGD